MPYKKIYNWYKTSDYSTFNPIVNKVRIRKSSPNLPSLNIETEFNAKAVAIAPLNPEYQRTILLK